MKKIAKTFALQYIASEAGTKISYRNPVEEQQHSKATLKRRRQPDVSDKSASFRPQDKSQHFDDDDFQVQPRSKKCKLEGNAYASKDTPKKWKYFILMATGIMGGYHHIANFETGKWVVQFYNDDETTERG